VVPRSYATSFAIQRDIFLSFFGEINPNSESPGNNYSDDTSESYDTRSWENEGNNTDMDGFQENNSEPQDVNEHPEHESPGDFEPTLSESDDPLSQTQAHQSRADSWETGSISTLSDFWAVNDLLISLGPSTTPSNFINDVLSQTNDILLYSWQTRQYAQLSSSPQDDHLFHRKVQLLAGQNQMFISIGRNRPYLVLLKNLYDIAIREKLILVGPKQDRMGLSSSLMSQARNGIFEFLDSA
jgi:hypothetical protein